MPRVVWLDRTFRRLLNFRGCCISVTGVALSVPNAFWDIKKCSSSGCKFESNLVSTGNNGGGGGVRTWVSHVRGPFTSAFPPRHTHTHRHTHVPLLEALGGGSSRPFFSVTFCFLAAGIWWEEKSALKTLSKDVSLRLQTDDLGRLKTRCTIQFPRVSTRARVCVCE